MRSAAIAALAITALHACAQTDDAENVVLSLAELQDPETCRGCHARHYSEWASSMHAYAAQDPVFTAMNERGQLETDGELGDFCVRCHAPMATALGLTDDGLDLIDLDDPNARGVTCYFCHNVSAVTGTHNNPLELAHDAVMRGGLGDPDGDDPPARANRAHGNAYSPLHDGDRAASAALCGSCHDVVNPNGVHVERTFAEWQASRFGADGEAGKSCGGCHMPSYRDRAAADAEGASLERELHSHMWPGVDVALTDHFPGVEAQRLAIECAFRGALRVTLSPRSEAPPFSVFDVTIENVAVGHAWPSGAAQDRRAFIELHAYDDGGQQIFESGAIEEGQREDQDTGPEVEAPWRDDQLVLLRDALFDAEANPVHMFWLAEASAQHPAGYQSEIVPAPAAEPGRKQLSFRLPEGSSAARVELRLRLRPIGLDVFDDFAGLVLPITERAVNVAYFEDRRPRSRMRTITVPGSELQWTPETGVRHVEPSDEALSQEECDAQAYVLGL